MRIVFYSTNSNKYKAGSLVFGMNPSCHEQWQNLIEKFPNYEFFVVAQRPGMFLIDDLEKEQGVKTIFVRSEDEFDIEKSNGKSSLDEISDVILGLRPDVAIAVSYWASPFDWMSIKDALVAENLRKRGVRAVCHSSKTASICFDKWKTHQFLENNGFNCARCVYVQHEMFYAERRSLVIVENIYREYIFSQIEKLNFPVVIKDVYGLSSYGMDVVNSFEKAKSVLLSKKNNSDRMVEEFIDGISFGCEIYGSGGNYTVTPPLSNSVNQFGLTSPKQNVKLGPVIDNVALEKFHIEELKSEMLRLSELLDFDGIAQVDLIFFNRKWFVLEINSRISGMTQTMAYSMSRTLYEQILFSANLLPLDSSELKYRFVMNLKFPLLTDDKIERLMKKSYVFAVNKIENHEAKQLREMGYTEVIFGGTETLSETMEMLEELNREFPEDMVSVFYENAKKLSDLVLAKNYNF